MKVCSVCQRCYDDSVLSCSEENHPALTAARAGTSESIANYRLEFLYESSHSGDTYRAVNTILNKPYLMKILAPALFDAKSKKQFLAEAQSLAAIIHPNVARVFESGSLADGSVYVVTEYFSAQTLRECLTNVGAPSEVTALTIVRQAAEGLEALHEVGVMHRNIRPENIILTADAENHFLIKLQNIDFGGIGQKIVISEPELNLAGLRYFSPEQCGGKSADAQTDVYGLGVVLYETLAGKVPFDAPYADALIAKQINEPPPPVKINSFDLRMLLTHTLTDALQKTTRTRLKTASAFARRIRHIEQLATHSPTPPPAMSYPAMMNKTAIVFTPPAKLETPAVLEKSAAASSSVNQTPAVVEASPTVFEIVPEVETPVAVEEPVIYEDRRLAADLLTVEASPAVEDQFAAEARTEAESPVLFEVSPEDPAGFEVQTPYREIAPVETEFGGAEFIPVETLSMIEDAVPVEEPAVIAEAVAVETRPMIEELAPAEEVSPDEMPSVTEDLPLIEAKSMAEDAVEIDARAVAADSFGFENAPAFENSDSLATQPLEADLLPVETPAGIGEDLWAKAEAEEAAAHAPEPFDPLFNDLSTTKLPPLESIIDNPAPVTEREIETVTAFAPPVESSEIHQSKEPVLVEWEQPDDVPTITQALGKRKKAAADAAFAAVQTAPVAVVEEPVIEMGEIDAPVASASEENEPRRDYAAELSVFSYDDSGTSWNLLDKRKLLTGAGIAALIVFAVGATLLSRQFFLSRDTRQTTAKSAPADRTQPKSAEPAKVSETELPALAKPEQASVNNPVSTDESAEVPPLPNYQPRETAEKIVVPISQTRPKKREIKELSETRSQVAPSKPAVNPVFDKKGEIRAAPDKKSTVKGQGPGSTKSDIFTRPRIVKNP
jgi:serine/threonine protein kinase